MLSSFGQYGGGGQMSRQVSGPAMYERVRKGNSKPRMDSTKTGSTKPSLSSSTELIKNSTLELHKNKVHSKFNCKNCLKFKRCEMCAACGDAIMVINVSGLKFETHETFFRAKHPNTLLGDPVKFAPYYDSLRKEIFLDRHRPSFEVIFSYLREGGKLRRPNYISDFIFYEEIVFYELDENVIAEYLRSEGNVEDDVIRSYGHGNRCRGFSKFKSKIWTLFEFPETSKFAQCIGFVSIFVTILSIAAFIVETMPIVRNAMQNRCHGDDRHNLVQPFFLLEVFCSAWFTFELIVRLLTCPCIRSFLRGYTNWIDFLSVLPFYLGLVTMVTREGCLGDERKAGWLALLRVLRVSRIFKLTKHSVGLQVLMDTFRASVEGLMIFLSTLIFCTVVYSSLLFYAEIDVANGQIESIPHGFWWAVITMTTVGYGDQVPVSTVGKIIGIWCAVTGVLTLAIPIPIITNNFNKFYSFRTGKGLR